MSITRYRGIESLNFEPGSRTVILGPQNAGKSTVLEALDLLLHHGFGRPRQPPTEIDYFNRSPSDGFKIEAVIGDPSPEFIADVRDHLKGWKAESSELVPEPDGDGIEAVVRVRVSGTEELTHVHEIAEPGIHSGSSSWATTWRAGATASRPRRSPGIADTCQTVGAVSERLAAVLPAPAIGRLLSPCGGRPGHRSSLACLRF